MYPTLLTMISNSERPEQEIADPQEIRQSLTRLDRSTSWFRWNTIGVLILLFAALVALSLPELLGRYNPFYQYHTALIVQGLLVLMLISNGYMLYQHREFKLFRHRLGEQMQTAITQRMRADKFYGLAILDPLTGLYNRRYGEECLRKEITRAERHNYDLAVIVVDLDHFKEINDQFGHAAGDVVLREFSNRLRRSIRACDVPIRIGGDEFLVVLPECPRENVHIILSRLGPFEVILNRQKVVVSYSRGRAQYQISDTPQTLLQRADEVLYAEKAARPLRFDAPGPQILSIPASRG
jgi:diguanylate cyclase (GGDEF)-like protein